VWQDIAPWLLSAGVIGAMLALVRIAVGAERRRADDWRSAYEREVTRGEVRDAQLGAIMRALHKDPP